MKYALQNIYRTSNLTKMYFIDLCNTYALTLKY